MIIEKQTETKTTGFTITLTPDEAKTLANELGRLWFESHDLVRSQMFAALVAAGARE